MTRMRPICLAIMCTMPLASPAVSEDAALSEGQLRSELVGKQIAWWEDGGWLGGHLMLLPDGRAELSIAQPRRRGDTGRWSIRNGEICTLWNEARSGSEKCYAVRKVPSGRFVTTGGNVFEVRETGA